MIYFFFFFQAEDGIRDHCVTGVQTCALPIYAPWGREGSRPGRVAATAPGRPLSTLPRARGGRRPEHAGRQWLSPRRWDCFRDRAGRHEVEGDAGRLEVITTSQKLAHRTTLKK